MKDSGVEWLGVVPKHWDVIRLAQLFHEISEPGEDALPILSVSIHDGVSDGELDEDEMERKVTRSDDRSKYKRVAPGDLVYNMMRAWQGGFGSVEVPGMVSPAYVVARPIGRNFVTGYIEQLLRTAAGAKEAKRYSRGVTDFRLRLYWDEFKNICVPLPPKGEQVAIMHALDDSNARIDGLATEARTVIGLLHERRAALISAAVTGKIDVREHSSALVAAA
jgi:type I restriction enzyme S subunit